MVWGAEAIPTTSTKHTVASEQLSPFIVIETEVAPTPKGSDLTDLLQGLAAGKCHAPHKLSYKDKYPLGPTDVRRPVMGMQLKAERHAYLQVFDKNGVIVPLYNQAGGWNPPKTKQDNFPGETILPKSDHYTDFMVTSVTEQRAEKVQIVETFGEDYFYSTGQRPQVISVVGHLCNSQDFPWRAQFWENYNRYFRGSKLLETQSRSYFGWDDILVEGYVISASASESADNQNIVHFNFNYLVTDYISLAELRFKWLQSSYKRTDLGAFWEMVQRGKHVVYSDNSFVLSSPGMRARQRFVTLLQMQFGGGLFNLLQTDPTLIGQVINDPQAVAELIGRQATRKLGEAGEDLIFEELGAAFDAKRMMNPDQACMPWDMKGKDIVKEGWLTAAGWIRKILKSMRSAGVPTIPGWDTMYLDLTAMLTHPGRFLELLVSRHPSGGDAGFTAIGTLVGLGLGASFLWDSFVPSGAKLSVLSSEEWSDSKLDFGDAPAALQPTP